MCNSVTVISSPTLMFRGPKTGAEWEFPGMEINILFAKLAATVQYFILLNWLFVPRNCAYILIYHFIITSINKQNSDNCFIANFAPIRLYNLIF